MYKMKEKRTREPHWSHGGEDRRREVQRGRQVGKRRRREGTGVAANTSLRKIRNEESEGENIKKMNDKE